MNAGERTVEWLFREQLGVDPEWSVRTPRGFRWWPDKNAQAVEVVGQENGPDGEIGYLLSIRTEMLRSLKLDEHKLEIINGFVMRSSSLAGPVYDEQTRSLSLASLVRIHDGISQWMNAIISVAALLQIFEARNIGAELAPELGAQEALSGPPGRGMRPERDRMADIITAFFVSIGELPSQWTPTEFQQTVDTYMNQPPALLATSGGPGFTVEFPYGDHQSSLCQAIANQPHPLYGNGLLMLQSFPVAVESEIVGAKLALSLNSVELTQKPFGYGFGSYVYLKNTLYFTCFFPNVLYRPGLLPNIYFSCAQRARAISLRLTGADWTEGSFSPSRSSVGQLIELMDRMRGDDQ